MFDNIAKPEPTVSGLYTIEPVAIQHGGTLRYYLRPRLKPSTRRVFSHNRVNFVITGNS